MIVHERSISAIFEKVYASCNMYIPYQNDKVKLID